MSKFAHHVKPGKKLKLSKISPDEMGDFNDKKDPDASAHMAKRVGKMVELQEKFFAEKRQGLLVVLQAMDTGGKDGVLRRVAGPLDSRGVKVVSFGVPNALELAHDYLWRAHAEVPKRGDIVFFNRSYYEDVLVARVMKLVDKSVWKKRYEHINAFEKMLTDEGIAIVKMFLHISKDEQKKRLQERLDTPEKHWKWNDGDLVARAHWDAYESAYEDAMEKTSTDYAPWYVIPANRKWFRDLAVTEVLCDTLAALKPKPPHIHIDTTKIKIR